MTINAEFPVFHYELLIREHHLDTFGHVNNATYLQLFEEARWDFITTRGVGLEVIQTQQIGPVVLELTLKFLKEIRLREMIRIDSHIINYAKKVGVMQQQMFNQDEQCCCDARLTFGLFDLKARRLLEPPAHWLKALGLA
jgi:acyl-CoA thioester hydrolase